MSLISHQKPNWNKLYQTHANKHFIEADPIQLAYQYSDPRDQEFISFLTCLFAYGGRPLIIKTVSQILEPFGKQPLDKLLASSEKDWQKWLAGFYYRFNTLPDLLFILSALKSTYRKYDSLEAAWQKHAVKNDTKASLSAFQNFIMSESQLVLPDTYGMQFILAEPMKGSAAKRLNMFLRWVVRDDEVDLGLWKNALTPADLIIPLDTHVARQSRKYRITKRASNDWKTAEEITAYFRKIDASDPVRFDLAMMGLGTTKT